MEMKLKKKEYHGSDTPARFVFSATFFAKASISNDKFPTNHKWYDISYAA